ncbi:hypothetical protein Mapa_004536 [Marchantia paleacea]|nr:hypothetical protein Mapa_004536 [Marchantia paleacea]
MVESTVMDSTVAFPRPSSSSGGMSSSSSFSGIGLANGHGNGHGHKRDWRKTIAMKASTEYDSEGGVFLNKISARVLDGLAKVKAAFERGANGEVNAPLFGLVTKYVSVLYDHEDQNAQVTVNKNWRNLGIKYRRDIKAEQGELSLTANAFNAKYRAEIDFDLPQTGSMPRASVTFPFGEVKVFEEIREDEEGDEFRAMAASGFLAGPVLGGLFVADFKQENLTLKYAYKDEEMTLIPSISLPSISPTVAFKRQFDNANKLSYLYNFDTTGWSTVYKHKPNDAFKLKLGYDSDVKTFWGSTWVGKEDAGAKKAPRKCKLQVMVQVPQEDVKNSVVLFRIKKRWDL